MFKNCEHLAINITLYSKHSINQEFSIMPTKIILFVFLLMSAKAVYSFDFDVTTLRATLSKPDTSHTLIYDAPGTNVPKTVFNLTPLNNERLGFFVEINDIEIGYALDIFNNATETKTQDFLFSYRQFKHSRITFNYQTLEGLDAQAINLQGLGVEQRFLTEAKSSKIELFGLHNLYTLGNGSSLFEHFFQNRPALSHQFDWALSLAGGWSVKRLSLKSTTSILFAPAFINQTVPAVTALKATSFNANVGPLLSINLPNNFNAFAEYKYGKGYIKNQNNRTGLKQSGDEKSTAVGLGFSWTAPNKKTLLLLRGWNQKGRHIQTSFGDFSVLRFF